MPLSCQKEQVVCCVDGTFTQCVGVDSKIGDTRPCVELVIIFYTRFPNDVPSELQISPSCSQNTSI